MSRYLIVAHQTATSPELRSKVKALIAEDTAAEFAVLVPAAPGSTFSWEGETVDVAGQRAEASRTLLEAAGATVIRTAVGKEDPLQAIADEIREHPGYHAIVVCTLPPGISRWLSLDLPHRVQRKFRLPVHHVVAEAGTLAAAPRRPH
jgi:hypothetical protein